MSSLVNVAVHASQFPDQVRNDLLLSLRTRRINHKFHYLTYQQSQKWLALHQAHSPSRTDADCAAIYDHSFADAAAKVATRRTHLIGLGCGGGQKDARLLRKLKEQGRETYYTACDASLALVLTAREAAISAVPKTKCQPLVCDLASASDLPELFAKENASVSRVFTFFGMIPNFEPELILPRLSSLVRPDDFLLFSANLAPGSNYAAGMRRILPGYDNALTRDWLGVFLHDLGVESGDGKMSFTIENAGPGLKRVRADFQFARNRTIQAEGETFEFRARDKVRLFFSYRYTPEKMAALLHAHDLAVLEQWIAPNEEEGVFLCRKTVKKSRTKKSSRKPAPL